MSMLTLAVLYLLRSYSGAAENHDFTERVFAAQERHPGLIEEIWFAGCGDEFGKPEEMGREAGADGHCGVSPVGRTISRPRVRQEGPRRGASGREVAGHILPDGRASSGSVRWGSAKASRGGSVRSRPMSCG